MATDLKSRAHSADAKPRGKYLLATTLAYGVVSEHLLRPVPQDTLDTLATINLIPVLEIRRDEAIRINLTRLRHLFITHHHALGDTAQLGRIVVQLHIPWQKIWLLPSKEIPLKYYLSVTALQQLCDIARDYASEHPSVPVTATA